MDAKILAQIEQMLKKAESTYPAEAEMITARAEKLMIRHGINQAMIEARRAESDKPESIDRVRIHFTGTYAAYQSRGAALIIQAFGTMQPFLQKVGKRDMDLIIVGFQSDLEHAKRLVESLHLQSLNALKVWAASDEGKATRASVTTQGWTMARRQFFYSFGLGASERIRASRAEAVAEVTGSELALIDRGKAVDQHVRDTMATRQGARVRGSQHGHTAGRAAGLRANTGEGALGGHKALR